MTAGRRLAAAVPEVQTRAMGARQRLAKPRAKKPADRSSSSEMSSRSG